MKKMGKVIAKVKRNLVVRKKIHKIIIKMMMIKYRKNFQMMEEIIQKQINKIIKTRKIKILPLNW